MEPSTKGYSPEQVATGNMENGREVVILYIKEFSEELSRISESGNIGYFYTWSHIEESDSFVLFIYWDNGEEIAVVFPPNQHSVVEVLKTPKELIITGVPIDILVQNAREAGQDFFDLSGSTVYLEGVVFKEQADLKN